MDVLESQGELLATGSALLGLPPVLTTQLLTVDLASLAWGRCGVGNTSVTPAGAEIVIL